MTGNDLLKILSVMPEETLNATIYTEDCEGWFNRLTSLEVEKNVMHIGDICLHLSFDERL